VNRVKLCVVLLKEYLVPEAYGPGGDAHALPPNFCGRAKINATFGQNIKISEKI
jgi:hypothetical protein